MKSLRRLHGTAIQTNIKANSKRIEEAWHWIDYWQVIEDEETGKMIGIEVVISEWLYNRIVKDKAILSIHEEYFLLTGGIDRWLYRIARKHCGNNEMWSFSVKALYDKYPPGREYRFFKRDLKKVVLENSLPEYDVFWIEGENNTERVMFQLRPDAKFRRLSPKSVKKEFDKVPKI